MENKLIDLIDFEKVNTLLEGFNKTTGFVTAMLDLDGNVLSKSGWRQICTQFHRVHPETAKNCKISDTILAKKLAQGEKYHCYKCLNGLTDIALPIIINGEHIANLFSGQFFFEKPNRDFFSKQANKYKFDTTKYLDALENVPVVSKDSVHTAMSFLLDMIQLIIEMTTQKKEQFELNEALKESEEKFRSLYDNAPLSYQSLNEDGSFRDINPTWLNTLGYERDEVIGKFYKDFLHPDWQAHFEDNFPKFKKRGYVNDVQFKIRHKAGHYIDISFEGCIGYHPDGSFKQTYCVFTDITERKKIEKELKENEFKFRTLANYTSAWEYWVDENKNIIYISPSCEKISGYTQEEFISDPKKLINIVHPDDISAVKEHNDKNHNSKTGAATKKIEFRIIKKDKSIVHISHTCRPIYDEKKNYLGQRASNRDITERKLTEQTLRESEIRFRALHNASFGGIAIHDMGIIKECNQGLSNISGYTREELIGMDGLLCIAENSRKIVNQNINAGYEKAYEVVGLRKNGEEYPLRLEGKTIPYKGKNMRVVEFRDITESKQTEKALEESEKHYRTLFNDSPIPLWEEDLTELSAYLFELKEKGNKDLRSYFENSPDELMKCAKMVKVLDVNQATLNLHEAVTKEQLIGNVNKTFTANSFHVFTDELIAIIEGKKIFESEAEVKTLSGDLRYIYITLKIDYSQANKVKVLLATSDITEQKLAKEALLINQKRYKDAQTIGHVGNWEYDLVTTNFWASDEAIKIYGYDLEQKDFTTEDVESCIPERERVHQALIDLIEHDKKYDLVFDIITKDKGIRKTVHSIAKIEKDALGNPSKVSGVVSDITERKKAEEKLKDSEYLYKETQRLSKMGGWSYDVESGQATYTDTLYEIYGTKFSTAEEGIQFYHPDDQELVSNSFSEVVTKQKPYDLEVRFINAQGNNLFVRTIGQPVIKNGKVVKVYGNLIDITEHKMAEQELTKHREHLEELVKERTLELEAKNEDLKRMNKLFVGRELRMIELKEKIEELKNKTKNT